MKKVIFLQINGKTYGGVWQVNRLIGEELIKHGYDVTVLSLRNNPIGKEVEHDEMLKVKTINEKDPWYTYRTKEFKEALSKGKIFTFTKMAFSRIKHDWILNKDIKTLQEYIRQQKPDYIINTHYQLLDMIPEEYLKVTIHEQHSSFMIAYKHDATRETLLRYNGKVKFLWLTKSALEDAEKAGFVNNFYIYNAVRFTSEKRADVNINKKLIALCRLSDDKNLDQMVDIAEKLFEDKELSGWSLEIYGDGELQQHLKEKIQNKKQIKLMGRTDDSKKVLLESSINLNTSPSEGFSLTILEANECGIPTVCFYFGESVYEEIIDGKTGFICKDEQDYVDKLSTLMKNAELLDEISINCRKFSENFHIENIISKWLDLLK